MIDAMLRSIKHIRDMKGSDGGAETPGKNTTVTDTILTHLRRSS